jgi:hypothetical protein
VCLGRGAHAAATPTVAAPPVVGGGRLLPGGIGRLARARERVRRIAGTGLGLQFEFGLGAAVPTAPPPATPATAPPPALAELAGLVIRPGG